MKKRKTKTREKQKEGGRMLDKSKRQKTEDNNK